MSVDEPTTVETTSSPGAQLRKAREEAGISLEVIAERTLISLHKLRALERDDFAGVGGRAYATGYTRAYARVVGIDAKGIIKDIESAFGAEVPKAASGPQSNASASAATSRAALSAVPWYYPAIIVVLLVLLIVWLGLWLVPDKIDEGDPVDSVRSAEPRVPNGAEPNSSHGVEMPVRDSTVSMTIDRVENEREAPAAAHLPEEGADSSPQAELPPTPQEVIEAGQNERGEEPEPASAPEPPADELEQSGLAPALRQNINAEVPVVAPAGADPQESAGDAAVADDQLRLSFTQECWLEVSDATGRTLIADLASAGQTREVTGVAPFRVTLGDAQAAAEIVFNEEVVSFAPRPGRRVLRLTIGE